MDMLQQLLDDLRGYFESKPSLTETEQCLLDRLNSGYFPITSIHRDDLAGKGFDTGHVSDEDMKYLARKMADDYCEQLFWPSMEIIASEMANISKFPACPQCLAEHSLYESASRIYQCAECGRTWSNDYVLVEFPDDASYFEENDIGYPSFGSEDNGARYVPEYDYIRHFQKTPAGNAYYKPLCWPESQPYLFPDEPNESADALCEPVSDEKGITDFGEQAVWVPLCHLKIRRNG